MNFHLLPKELQETKKDEFKVEHKFKMEAIANELFIKNSDRITRERFCVNCSCYANEKYTKYIFWNKYVFCGERCQSEGEKDIRKSYLRSFQI